ncbi:hypothetical protein [Nibricoccus sp. IMCC34717]|uniref:hypothetical protein n=1 Tax=Nibricoccus sp. IMCC34717 TaxID=3034021 RepID=UPI00384C7C8D
MNPTARFLAASLAVCSALPLARAAAPTSYFPWTAPTDPAAQSEISLRSLNETVAGEHGFIQARDGKFWFETNNQAVRFWAVNGPSSDYLSDADLAREARVLAAYGVNLVRVHGAIFTERGEVDGERVKALRRIVRAMKAEGIYTHLSIYFPLWFKPTADLSWLPGYDGTKFPFAVLMFNPNFQDKYKTWVTALLTNTDATDSKPLKQEPALMGLEIQNEDSFFFWTFDASNIPDAQLKIIEAQFGTWAANKYGTIAAALTKWNQPLSRDNSAEGRLAFRPLWNIANERTERDKDTAAFLTETQTKFYRDMAAHARSVGFKGLVTGSNWTTADSQILGPLDKMSYTEGDFIDRHGYLGCNSKGDSSDWSIRENHTYRDRRVLRFEGEENETKLFVHPAMEIEYNGKPSMISETTWTRPNRHRGEAPMFIAAYGALQDTDSVVHFAFDGSKWQTRPNFWMQPWTLMSPAMMGQFPVAARLYRQGLVDEGEVLADVVLNKADLLALKGTPLPQDAAFDDLRAKDIPAGLPGAQPNAVVDPLIHFAGRTRVTFSDDPGKLTLANLAPLIDREAGTVKASTGQVDLDYKVGILRVKAPKVEYVGGQLNAKPSHSLDVLEVATEMDPAHVSLVSLDGLPLTSSRRMLLQVMTEERTTGFATTPDTGGRLKITNKGSDPWEVRRIQGTITLHRDESVVTAYPLDAGGVKTGRTINSASFPLEQETVYYLIETMPDPSQGSIPTDPGRPIGLSVRGQGGVGGDTLIAGFAIRGTGTKTVLVRASGPALEKFSVPSPLPDPKILVHRSEGSDSVLVAENDDWDSSLASTFASVGMFAWTNGSRDAALLLDLPEGNYTAQVGNGSTPGRSVLIEVYDVSKDAGSTIIGLSCRTTLAVSEPVIVGLALDRPAPVLLRNGGPSLIPFGLSTASKDTTLTVYDNQTPIASNDDWRSSLAPLFAELGAYSYGSSTKDSALRINNPPSQITAFAQSKGAPGVGLVELYLIR